MCLVMAVWKITLWNILIKLFSLFFAQNVLNQAILFYDVELFQC